MKKLKNIVIVIREMIEECEKLGHHAREIKLSEKDYKRLFDYLKKDTDMYYREEYEIVPTGIVYHPQMFPKNIDTFMGIPVVKNYFTTLVWI